MTATLDTRSGSTSLVMLLSLGGTYVIGSNFVAVDAACHQAISAAPIRLSEAELEAWGATHQPPRSWYEQDEEDLS